MLEGGASAFIPVAIPPPPDAQDERPELIGAVYLVDALRAYNRMLIETHKEEHG